MLSQVSWTGQCQPLRNKGLVWCSPLGQETGHGAQTCGLPGPAAYLLVVFHILIFLVPVVVSFLHAVEDYDVT